MSTTTIWTHGNSLTVEDPRDAANLWHFGWGSQLTFAKPRDNEDPSGATRYCHIVVPTPRILNGDAMHLTKLIVLFETQGQMLISRIDVWDANLPVAQFDEDINPAGRAGSHLTIDSTNQLFLPKPYPVQYGIGVSFVCELTFFEEEQPPLILTLAAIGAEFYSPLHVSHVPPTPVHPVR